MDIQKADYSTIIQFGNIVDFKKKISESRESINKIIGIVDKSGMSLLHHSLRSRNFDVSIFLLENGSPVNVLSRGNFNELHFIAVNINESGAVNIAKKLLNLGVDLNCVDKKYKNTAGFSLCLEIFKKRTEEGLNLILDILKRKPNFDAKNSAGNSIRSLLLERGTEEMKVLLE
jgi:ankyrin repeat protein